MQHCCSEAVTARTRGIAHCNAKQESILSDFSTVNFSQIRIKPLVFNRKTIYFRKGKSMPDQITVSEFVVETNEDYKAPTASNFTTRMSHCRNTVSALEEVSGEVNSESGGYFQGPRRRTRQKVIANA